jgi:hypothetical protein
MAGRQQPPLDNAWIARRTEAIKEVSRRQGAALEPIRISPPVPGQGVVLCNIKNEALLLPHFLNHYRRIGVRRFAFVDNGSTDDTLTFLLDQTDCDVFRNPGDFRAAMHGMAWKNWLSIRYADAAWRLSADADEHAVFAGWPGTSLDEFSARLGKRGRGTATALMVDMYSDGPLVDARVSASRDMLEICPFVDGDGYSISAPANWRVERFPRLDVRGGPMSRLYGSPGRGWLAKTPLILEPGILFSDPHTVIPVCMNFAVPTIALLHFKFTELLTRRIAGLPARGYTEGSAATYRKLASDLEADPRFTLRYPGSVRFNSFEEFLERCIVDDRLARNTPAEF